MERGHWKSARLWIQKLSESINSPEQKSVLTYCFFVDFVAIELAADLKYISLKKNQQPPLLIKTRLGFVLLCLWQEAKLCRVILGEDFQPLFCIPVR